MPDVPITIVLPNGGARRAEMPDDVPVGELMTELTSLLKLPTVGPDGRPMGYRMDSKALGRELTEKETLASAQIPVDDRLMITADITAGTMGIEQSPRMRRLRSDLQLIQEMVARSDMIQVEPISTRPGVPPERYIVTFKCKSIIGVDNKGNPKYADKHQVDIYLHNQYPQRWPGMKWLTPIWHPNINHLNGSVCIDAAWWAASRSLDRLVIMLGEMLQYKNFHDDPTKPPFPWDPEAATWCREYRAKHPNVFPLDQRELLRPERVKITKLALRAKTPGVFRGDPQGKASTTRKPVDARLSAPKPAAATQAQPKPAVTIQRKPASEGRIKIDKPAEQKKPRIRIK